MYRIATTIYEELNESEKKEIQEVVSSFGENNLYEYVQKGTDENNPIKFIIDGFDLKSLTSNVSLWDQFHALLSKLLAIGLRKSEVSTDIQFWLRDLEAPAPINIAFAIREEQQLSEAMLSLREKLISDLFSIDKEEQKGKIISLGYYQNDKIWTMQIL